MDRRVPLPGGGYLVIDDTEAMTVIDVNSGRNVGKGGNRLEDTITKTNLEAATEVVRQLRLRDIGGIVIIDFIDMDDDRNRKAVKAALDEALARRPHPHLRRRHLAARPGGDDPPEHLRRAARDHDRGVSHLRRRGRGAQRRDPRDRHRAGAPPDARRAGRRRASR